MNQTSLNQPSTQQISGDSQQKRMRILLGQLGSNGDCLYATTVARQIKHDYPGCHLTWAIGSMYRHILDNNPDVDEVWEIPLSNILDIFDTWQRFEAQALERKKIGDFDEIFLTQMYPNNMQNFDRTIRSAIFRAYSKPITVSIAPVIYLLPDEIERVSSFAKSYNLSNASHVILFECSPKSGQSFVNPEFALKVSRKLLEQFPDLKIILSSNIPIKSDNEGIIDGSLLSFRENAELTKYCSLLIGCSSGISWLSTSTWAKPLPMVQLIKKEQSMYVSFIRDHQYHGLPTDQIIEMTECSVDYLVDCVTIILTKGFQASRSIFNNNIKFKDDPYLLNCLNFWFKRAVKFTFRMLPKYGLVYTGKWLFNRLLVLVKKS
jgi:hypothetical protein